MTAVALSWSDSPKLPRMAAWLVVLLVHGLMAVWLLGSGRMTLRSDEGARMTLYWLPPKQPVPAQPHPAQPTAEAARPAASTAPRPPPAAPKDASTPAFAPRRNYFRIRRQMTPEQIVHGVAQLLGLWPPGYIVDPCELGKQDMDYFQNAVEEADRDVLRAAVLQVSARCR